jgi:hypothetical protein
MATTVAELQAKLSVDKGGFDRGMRDAEGTLDRSGDRIGKKSALIGKWVTRGLVGGAGAVGFLGVKMIGLASDAAEVESKFKITFGREMPRMTKEIDKFAEATGGSRFEMRQQVADMGALLVPMLKNKKAAGDMSLGMAELASDLGSFNNVPTAEALEAIRSGLVGETEPLRRFGVLINEAAVKEEAYRLGIAKRGAELTEQNKVQARASLIMQQTTLAQGDATRTSGSMANQMKELKNKLTDLGTEIGQKLLPYALRLVTWANEKMPGAIDWLIVNFGKMRDNIVFVRDKIRGLIEFFGDAWQKIKDVVFNAQNGMKIDMLAFALKTLELADKAFGWLPKLGPKIDTAIADIKRMKEAAEAAAAHRYAIRFVTNAAQVKSDIENLTGALPGRTGDGTGRTGDGSISVNLGNIIPSYSGAGGPKSISSALYDDIAMGKRYGLSVTSGYRPGAITSSGNPSLHGVYPSKAVDLAGSAGAMTAFFRAEIARGAPGIRELIHSPYWYHPGSGITRISDSSVMAGHYNHVHVGVYDKGGWLPPHSSTLAINKTPHWEPVGPAGGNTYNTTVVFPSFYGDRSELEREMQKVMSRYEQRNIRRFGSR